MAVGSGTALSLFTEFVALTGPTIFKGPKEVINDAQLTNYATLGYMLRGQGMADILQGGQNIQDIIYLQATEIASSYKPNQDFEYENVQTGTTWTVPWRFFATYLVYTDHEIMLNGGGSQYSREARFHQYKNLLWRKYQQMHTDNLNYWEKNFWRVPTVAEMETATGQEMYSIPVFINEATNGLFNPITSATFTTVQQISPTATGNANWKNQLFSYGTGDSGFKVKNAANIIHYLERAQHSLDFRPPPLHKEYWESPSARPTGFIACSLEGKTRAMDLFRNSQDQWVNMSDPWNTPTFAGSPLVYVRQLDTATLYANAAGTALTTEDAANLTGPRYYLINPEYLRPVFHTDRYMYDTGEIPDRRQPMTHTRVFDTWGNLLCRSRQRHALLTPAADQTFAAA